ncbi:MAG TPA: hypothetical protein VGH39_18150 [Xanthobacteraceae bacterium]|jgi:hypothetical protein
MTSTVAEADATAAAGKFSSLAEEAVRNGTPELVPDEILQRAFSAAVRLYTAKSEGRPRELAPFGAQPVNATEAVTAICAIMRAADLNFFDLQMWYRRAPNE